MTAARRQLLMPAANTVHGVENLHAETMPDIERYGNHDITPVMPLEQIAIFGI
jgi:hypothetical protein